MLDIVVYENKKDFIIKNIESMDFKALAKRTKETKRQEKKTKINLLT